MKTYVQQIMLGTVTGTEETARETLRRIKAAGYDGLELNRFMIHPTSFFVRMLTKAAGMPTGKGGKLDWAALLKEAGLECVSLQTDLGSLEREPEAVLSDAEKLGADRLVITGLYRFDYGSEAEVKQLAARLNKAGETVRSSGKTLLYHNHNAELLRVSSDRTAYDLLIDETDPALLGFEFDSYWFTDAGADAKTWMRRLGNRMKLGTGSMDLDGLRKIAEENGVTDVILESHKNWIDKDPIKSLELSAQWLNARK